MMDVNIGPTTLTICESTAHCVVYDPTETLIDNITAHIFDNNYVCDAVYHHDERKAKLLQHKVGGIVTTDIDTIDNITKHYS